MNIVDLNLDPKKSLNNDTKKALVNIVEDEFSNQTTLYNNQVAERKDKLLEEYCKKVGYQKKLNVIRKKEQELEDARNALYDTGLDDDGTVMSTYQQKEPRLSKIRNLNKLLEKASLEHPNNLKNKIISRLWLANTSGEAAVILREVLGNGIIPTITKDQLLITNQ